MVVYMCVGIIICTVKGSQGSSCS